MLELMVVIGIIAIISAVVTPNILGWYRHQGLRSAVVELQGNLQLTKLAAVRQNQGCSLNINTGAGTYNVPCIKKTVSLGDYSGGVIFGGPGGEVTDNVISYSSRGFTTNGQTIYLTNGDNTAYYRIKMLTSGGITTSKWDGAAWE